MAYQVPHFINGKTVESQGTQLDIYNPATGKIVGHANAADQNLINQTVATAKTAFQTWSTISPLNRARIFFKFKTLLEANIDKLAESVTREHGKTLADARGSVQRGIDVVEFVCGIPNLLQGTFSENVAKDMDSYSVRQPLGVCLGITPFNFPAMIPLWMFPMAIACGNTFILKPSEKDPSCSILLAELAKQAGLPDGVLNVLQGDKSTVDALLAHPDIKSVSFVGSTPVAEAVYKTAIINGKRVQAFGGAKNHGVVMPDADIDQAAEAIAGAAYGSAGERCMALPVAIVVGEKFADAFIEKVKTQITKLKIGSGNEDNIDMGPLITKAHHEKVKSYIDLGVKEGAELVVDGRELKKSEGYFLGATLFDKVTPTMRIYKEEIFGPVLSVVRVPDLDAALKLINENQYGNGTAIFTRDGNAARVFANQVQVGMVGINIPIPVPVPWHSFGGWKDSIFADIHMHGMEGMRFYTKLKTVTQKWVKDKMANHFNMPTH